MVGWGKWLATEFTPHLVKIPPYRTLQIRHVSRGKLALSNNVGAEQSAGAFVAWRRRARGMAAILDDIVGQYCSGPTGMSFSSELAVKDR